MWLRKFRKLFVFNHISVAIYNIVNCLIVFIVISVLRLEYMNLRWEKFCCIILPRVLYHFAPCMEQNDTADHTFWMVCFKHYCRFMPVFLSPKLKPILDSVLYGYDVGVPRSLHTRHIQTVYYTYLKPIIYRSISSHKSRKKYFKNVDHLAPVSPIFLSTV